MTVTSSFITNIICILASNQVIVTMESGTYSYQGVPADTMALFILAPSKGEFLNKWIKNIYSCVRLT